MAFDDCRCSGILAHERPDLVDLLVGFPLNGVLVDFERNIEDAAVLLRARNNRHDDEHRGRRHFYWSWSRSDRDWCCRDCCCCDWCCCDWLYMIGLLCGRVALVASAETVNYTEGKHVDIAFVADCVVHAIALPLPSHCQGIGESILGTETQFVIAVVLFGMVFIDRYCARARERVFGLRVRVAHPAESGKFIRNREQANQVKIQSLEPRFAAEGAVRRGIGREAEL